MSPVPLVTVLKNSLNLWEPVCPQRAAHSSDSSSNTLNSFKEQLFKTTLQRPFELHKEHIVLFPLFSSSFCLWFQAGPLARGELSPHQAVLPDADPLVIQPLFPATSEFRFIGDLAITPNSSTPSLPTRHRSGWAVTESTLGPL